MSIWSLKCFYSEFNCGIAWNSLWMGILVGATTTLLGLAFALLVTRTGIKAKVIIKIQDKNTNKRVLFCGAYCGNGFHEDGVRSAIAVCDAFGVERPC